MELAQEAFSPVNLPYSVLLIILTGYWLIAILGIIDLGHHVDLGHGGDIGHGDFGGGGDVGDVGGHGDAGGHHASGGVVHAALGFFNFGDLPVMLYVSIVALVMWINSIQIHYWFKEQIGDWGLLVAAMLFVPNLIFGLFVAKYVSVPIKWVANQRPPRTKIIGQEVAVVSYEVNGSAGQCELSQPSMAPITLNVRTENNEVLRKGERAVVVREIGDGIYLVKQVIEA